MATPVINLPQVGILDTEAVVQRRPVVIDDAIAIADLLLLHVVGPPRARRRVAAQFLKALKDRLEAL